MQALKSFSRTLSASGLSPPSAAIIDLTTTAISKSSQQPCRDEGTFCYDVLLTLCATVFLVLKEFCLFIHAVSMSWPCLIWSWIWMTWQSNRVNCSHLIRLIFLDPLVVRSVESAVLCFGFDCKKFILKCWKYSE